MARIIKRFVFFTAVVLAFALTIGHRETEAHKAATSAYTFNKDIFPILRDHCGGCHIKGGPAPMGLLACNDGPNSATPWAQDIRELVIDEQMPPWYVDPTGPAVKGGHPLNPADSDKLLTWVSGGTPEGDPAQKPAKLVYKARWSGGMPDLKLPIDPEYTMAAGNKEETKQFVVATGLTESRWVKAVDLLPGAPSIVRNAVIALDTGPVLSVWVPGDDLIAAPSGAAFRLPAGAKLQVEIHYKKQWQDEGTMIKDRSTVGLYFTSVPVSGQPIQSLAIDGPKDSLKFDRKIPVNARVVAVRPSLDQVYGALRVQAVTPDGTSVPLLRLRMPRPEWRRRYWLAEPLEVPAGSRIEVSLAPVPGYIDLTGAGQTKTYPLQVVLDFVSE